MRSILNDKEREELDRLLAIQRRDLIQKLEAEEEAEGLRKQQTQEEKNNGRTG